jgi:hypothetical protein
LILGRFSQDLVRSIDAGGLGGIDRQVTEKMSARAKRFNLENKSSEFQYEDFIKLYDRLGVPEEEREGEAAANDDGSDAPAPRSNPPQFRLQAITVKGFGRDTDKNDVHEYFKDFNPISMEYVDATTINVVWALASSAALAMLGLSRPLLEREEEMEVNEVKAAVANSAGEDDEDEEEGGLDDDDDTDARRRRGKKENNKENILGRTELLKKVQKARHVLLCA